MYVFCGLSIFASLINFLKLSLRIDLNLYAIKSEESNDAIIVYDAESKSPTVRGRVNETVVDTVLKNGDTLIDKNGPRPKMNLYVQNFSSCNLPKY